MQFQVQKYLSILLHFTQTCLLNRDRGQYQLPAVHYRFSVTYPKFILGWCAVNVPLAYSAMTRECVYTPKAPVSTTFLLNF